jgi:hypothetical protein
MLGVVAVTAGLTAASGLAGVIVSLCGVAAVALAVVGWAGRRRPAVGAGKDGTSISVSSAGQPDRGQPDRGHPEAGKSG